MTALAVALRPDDLARLTLSGVPVQHPAPQLSETFDGSSVGGFTAQGSATITSGTEGRTAAGSVRVNLPANTSWTAGSGRRTLTGLVVGRVYRVRAWCRNPSATFTDRRGGVRVGGDGGPLVTSPVLPAAVWTEVVLTFRATTTSAALDLYNNGPTATVATFLSFDDLTVHELTELRSLVREDVNGTLTLPAPAPSLGTRALELPASQVTHDPVILDDATPARMGTVRWTATTSTTAASASLTWPAAGRLPVLTVPGQRTHQLEAVSNYAADYVSQSAHDDTWEDDAPLLTQGVLGARRGTLTLWCGSWDAAQAVVALYKLARPVMLRQATYAGMDVWHSVETLRVAPLEHRETGWSWTVTVNWREVRP